MKKIIRYFITYPIWANTIMFTILVLGFFFMRRINTSFFPEVKNQLVTVSVTYPGASPEEIEKSIILKIENNLRGIPGIDRISSISRENFGMVTIEGIDHYDINKIHDDVKNAVDLISTFPSNSEKPVIRIPKFLTKTISVAIYGNTNLWALKEKAEEFRDDLLAFDEISQVSIKGLPKREISVEISEKKLRAYELSFAEIASAIRSSNIDLSAGSIKTSDEKLLIRAYGQKDYSWEIKSIPIRYSSTGQIIYLGDIADVKEQWEDTPNATYYNGKKSIIVQIDKTSDEDLIEIAKIVRKNVADFSIKHPEVNIVVTSDASVSLKARIKLLVDNGILGFFLVVIVLSLFLNGRLSFWVAAGIPVSFAGMFIIGYLWGITINVISLMGMIIVVGILVDDAIVVAETIYQKHEKGIPAKTAAVEGLMEVISPVLTSVLTTIFAFLPFFFFRGSLGGIIYQLALVVIGALIFSLIESVFILPAHLAHSKGLDKKANSSVFRKKFDDMYKWLTEKLYGPALKWSITNKWLVIAIPIAYFFISLGLIKGQFVQISNFPNIPRDDATFNLTMRTGTKEEITDSILQNIETKIWSLNKKLKKERSDKLDVILNIQRTVGSNQLGDNGGHAGSLRIEMLEGAKRNIDARKIIGMIRKKIGDIPGSQKMSFSGGRWGKAVTISLKSNNLVQLEKAKEILKQKLKEYVELTDISDSDIEGWREIRLKLKPFALSEGLTLKDVAEQIRQGFFGLEVQKYIRGEDEIGVWVRYKEYDRSSIGLLEQMYIHGKTGKSYPLSSIAKYEIKRGRAVISHIDGRREIRVEADLSNPNGAVAPILSEIKRDAIPEVLAQVQGVQVSFEGRARNDKKFSGSFAKSFPIALVGITVILILVFRSPLQALIIFLMIPLGIMGAVWGHLFHGFHLSRLSIFGIIALAGIVINDSIVLIDQINRNLKDRMSVNDAVFKAGISRLRPIILTTVTTVAGMLPLIFETSRQAQFLIPMAISLSYGLLFGSIYILFTVPTLFLALNTLRFRYEKLFDTNVTRESVEPAVKEIAREQSIGDL